MNKLSGHYILRLKFGEISYISSRSILHSAKLRRFIQESYERMQRRVRAVHGILLYCSVNKLKILQYRHFLKGFFFRFQQKILVTAKPKPSLPQKFVTANWIRYRNFDTANFVTANSIPQKYIFLVTKKGFITISFIRYHYLNKVVLFKPHSID